MTDPVDPTPADAVEPDPAPTDAVEPDPVPTDAVQPDAVAASDVVGPEAAAMRRDDRAAKEAEAERRRRRDRVFGAVLADTTSDERGDRPVEDGSRDAELRRNVPPHHG